MQEMAEQQNTPMVTLSVAITSVIFPANRLEQLWRRSRADCPQNETDLRSASRSGRTWTMHRPRQVAFVLPRQMVFSIHLILRP
jgi:hypothetical protein